MTFLESLFIVGLFIAFIRWHWSAHVEELARRVNELSQRLDRLGQLDLEAPQKAHLNTARKALAEAIRLQQLGEVGESNRAVCNGHHFANLAESKSQKSHNQTGILAA